MTAALKMTCPRCRGKGYLPGHVVVYAGAPGTCFSCAGVGEIYKDKFYRAFGVGPRFVGVTQRTYLNADNPNNGVFKSVVTLRSFGEPSNCEFDFNEALATGEFTPNWGGRVRLVEITEEQARAFVKKYGYDSRVRVGDSEPADRETFTQRRERERKEQAA